MRTNESNAFPAGSPGLMWHRCKIRRVLPAYRRDRDLVDLSRICHRILNHRVLGLCCSSRALSQSHCSSNLPAHRYLHKMSGGRLVDEFIEPETYLPCRHGVLLKNIG
jgi:hypothetical protein